jgi:hypothetical protein
MDKSHSDQNKWSEKNEQTQLDEPADDGVPMDTHR